MEYISPIFRSKKSLVGKDLPLNPLRYSYSYYCEYEGGVSINPNDCFATFKEAFEFGRSKHSHPYFVIHDLEKAKPIYYGERPYDMCDTEECYEYLHVKNESYKIPEEDKKKVDGEVYCNKECFDKACAKYKEEIYECAENYGWDLQKMLKEAGYEC